MPWYSVVLNLDRRIIYTIVALLVIVPILYPLSLPIEPTAPVESIFADLEALPPGSDVMVSGDFGPSSKPELQPMLEAVLAHCFVRGHHVHLLTLWPDGPSLLQTAIEEQADIFNKESGTDYVFLGYKAGTQGVILGVMDSVTSTFRTDFYGRPTANLPMYQGNVAARDYDYLVEIAAGQSPEYWIAYGTAPNDVPMGLSCTAVSAAQYSPYLQAGQITGLAGGMKGTAEYEILLRRQYTTEPSLKEPGDATRGMDAQSAVHVFIVFSIILANAAYFAQRRRERAQARGAA